MLRDPIYFGEFKWKGKTYQGQHDPLISPDLFHRVQAIFEAANKPRYTKRGMRSRGC